jgi:hypothetical protein
VTSKKDVQQLFDAVVRVVRRALEVEDPAVHLLARREGRFRRGRLIW